MMTDRANMLAFDLDCKHCKKPRASLGTGIEQRQKAFQLVMYKWCVRCDRA